MWGKILKATLGVATIVTGGWFVYSAVTEDQEVAEALEMDELEV